MDGSVSAVEYQQLARAAFLDEDYEGARRHLELAFREWRLTGNAKAAARAAASLADLHGSCLGNLSAGQGWASRGRRLLEPIGRCVELGYLELSIVACEAPNVDKLLGSADLALRLALEFGDSDLEVRALADSGYALVAQGRLQEGFSRLDEAMAALSAGEVQDLFVAGLSYCALLSACDRSGDARRAEEWSRLIAQAILDPMGGRPHVLHAHCRLAYGSVLCTVGRWPEGESAMLEVLVHERNTLGHRGDAANRLAGLRLLQGRFQEAEDLLRSALTRPSAAEPLARLHILNGEPDLAASVAYQQLDAVSGDLLRTAALLAILVEAEIARENVAAAEQTAARLARLAVTTDDPVLRAESAVAAARVAFAQSDPAGALAQYRAAQDLIGDDRPLLCGRISLDMAEVLADSGDNAAAVVEAQRALATFNRLGAKLLADRTDALLRSLGFRTRGVARLHAGSASLTVREGEVLALLREGLTNAEIGRRLFISAKTAEHHVSHVLAKLGARTRAEAAATPVP